MDDVREKILQYATSGIIKGFYPTSISKRINVPLEKVLAELDLLITEGVIEKRYQLLCLGDNCYRVLDTKDNKDEFQVDYECEFCGAEHEGIYSNQIKEIYCGVKTTKSK